MMLILTPRWRTAVFFARIVMPFSRSRSIESMTRSATSWFARKAPDCQSIASTSVVFPWSTCATIATLRMSSRARSPPAGVCISPPILVTMEIGSLRGPSRLRLLLAFPPDHTSGFAISGIALTKHGRLGTLPGLEHEDLGCQVGVDVVGAHERQHLSLHVALDRADEVVAHGFLESMPHPQDRVA